MKIQNNHYRKEHKCMHNYKQKYSIMNKIYDICKIYWKHAQQIQDHLFRRYRLSWIILNYSNNKLSLFRKEHRSIFIFS
jgi:hypothetical protein